MKNLTENELLLAKEINKGIEQLSTQDSNPIFVSQVMAKIQNKEKESLLDLILSYLPQVASIAVCSFLLLSDLANLGAKTEESQNQATSQLSYQTSNFEPFELEKDHLFSSNSPDYSVLLDISLEATS